MNTADVKAHNTLLLSLGEEFAHAGQHLMEHAGAHEVVGILVMPGPFTDAGEQGPPAVVTWSNLSSVEDVAATIRWLGAHLPDTPAHTHDDTPEGGDTDG